MQRRSGRTLKASLASEVVRVARGEQCLPGAKLVDTVSELTLVAIRTAATSYPCAAELSLQGTRGERRASEQAGMQEDEGTSTLDAAGGWPRVHMCCLEQGCARSDASRGTQGSLDAAGINWRGSRVNTLYLAGSLARGALPPPLLRLPPRTIGAVGPSFGETQDANGFRPNAELAGGATSAATQRLKNRTFQKPPWK